jgi:hypothetical protein
MVGRAFFRMLACRGGHFFSQDQGADLFFSLKGFLPIGFTAFKTMGQTIMQLMQRPRQQVSLLNQKSVNYFQTGQGLHIGGLTRAIFIVIS